MKAITLDARLKAAAGYIRQGAVFADIGTDHAYLPIYLLTNGVVSSAIAADLAEGPLKSAEQHAKTFGLQDKIRFFQTDGLCGLEELGITDVAICGMGGELISILIDKAPFLKSPDIRLVLQPMSKQELLREYLAKNGFAILAESVGYAAGHSYSCICAEYSGVPYKPDPLTLYVGNPEISSEKDAKSFDILLQRKANALTKRRNGKQKVGESTVLEQELLLAIEEKRRALHENWRTI